MFLKLTLRSYLYQKMKCINICWNFRNFGKKYHKPIIRKLPNFISVWYIYTIKSYIKNN